MSALWIAQDIRKIPARKPGRLPISVAVSQVFRTNDLAGSLGTALQSAVIRRGPIHSPTTKMARATGNTVIARPVSEFSAKTNPKSATQQRAARSISRSVMDPAASRDRSEAEGQATAMRAASPPATPGRHRLAVRPT